MGSGRSTGSGSRMPARTAATPAPEPAPGPPRPAVPTHDSGVVAEPWVGRIAATDGMFVTDDRQRIVAWSSAAQRMLGFSPEEAIGRTCYQVVMGREPDGHPVCGRNCTVTRNARRGRGTAAYDVAAQTRQGEAKCLSNSVLVVEAPAGDGFHVIHLLREAKWGKPVMRTIAAGPAPDAGEPLAETLTRREMQVLRLFSQGSTIDEIATELSISVFTARNHVGNIQHKLGARSRLEMVLLGMRRGLV